MPPPHAALPDRFRGWRRRLRAIFNRKAVDREMHDELAFHIEMETEKNINAGMTVAEAHRQARLSFGGVARFTEDVRDVRNIGWLEDLRQDLRHAARSFRRAPGFAAAAVAALSLGIGANTAVFSVVHAVVLAPLPYAQPDRLVRIWEGSTGEGVQHGAVSPGTFVDLRSRSSTFERIAIFMEREVLFSQGGEVWESLATQTSAALFEILGVRPMLGQSFPREDHASPSPGPPPSQGEILISHALWQRQFGGDPDVVGSTILMDELWPYTIAGVMPPGFSFPAGTELWTPITYGNTVAPLARQFRYFGAIGQLRAEHTLEQAMQETAAIAAQLEVDYPESNAGWTVQLAMLDETIVGGTRTTLLVVFGLAGCVLLIACGNVATLAIARAMARQHETAVRVALGAGIQRLLRQWAAEGLLLALLGGLGGLVVGYWSSRLLLALAPADIPRLDEVAFTAAVLLFALFLTGAAALVVALAPALRWRDTGPLDSLRGRQQGGAISTGIRSREWLIGTQVALTMVLTVAAALLVRSFEQLQSTDLGYQRQNVLSAELKVPIGIFTDQRPWFQRLQFYEELMTDLQGLPGVNSVAGTTTVPLTGELGSGSLWRTDAPGAQGRRPPTSAADQWQAAIQIVTPGYFETLGIPLLSGRAFTETDRFTQQELTDPAVPRSPGVAVINEAMARRFWPGRDPLGETIFLFDDQTYASHRTIVGIVSDVRAESVDAAALPAVFLPFAQHPGRGLSLVVRSEIPPAQLTGAVTERLQAFHRAISVSAVRPLDTVIGNSLARQRFSMLLAGSFAALALAMAGIGVFGIVGFLVTRRTHEIGIRMALGARPANVLRLVLLDGLRPVWLGVAAGCVGAVAVARAMHALLYGLAPIDGASFMSAAALLIIVSFVAALIPLRKAVGVTPLRSLRRG